MVVLSHESLQFDAALMERVNSIPLLKTLAIRLKEVGENHATMEVAVTDIHANYLGGAHGGLIATLADTVSFFPRPLLPSGLICATTNLNVTYVRPAALGETLTARSELLHLGRRTASVTCRIVNGEGKLVAHSSATLMVLAQTDERENR
ncbi:MAG TPA: PaaI family thioesterase [Geobacteraceae bacterium]|nr:PaaI family thioesterase [Geobacteraceae bacterium]